MNTSPCKVWRRIGGGVIFDLERRAWERILVRGLVENMLCRGMFWIRMNLLQVQYKRLGHGLLCIGRVFTWGAISRSRRKRVAHGGVSHNTNWRYYEIGGRRKETVNGAPFLLCQQHGYDNAQPRRNFGWPTAFRLTQVRRRVMACT